MQTGGILTGRTVSSLTAGAMHTLALCADGTLVSWGFNGDGELGDNSTEQSNIPVAVSTAGLSAGGIFAGVKSAPTSQHSLALVASPPQPIVITMAASSVTATTAVLNGSLNANGSDTFPHSTMALPCPTERRFPVTPLL